MLLTASISD